MTIVKNVSEELLECGNRNYALECYHMIEGTRRPGLSRKTRATRIAAGLCLAAAAVFLFSRQYQGSQKPEIVWSVQEKPIVQSLRGLRALPDDVRARTTKDLALQIRRLPATPNKLTLANALANLSTEGDFGHDTLEEVATTLADALREQPPAEERGQPAGP